jgi:hypothetical protein
MVRLLPEIRIKPDEEFHEVVVPHPEEVVGEFMQRLKFFGKRRGYGIRVNRTGHCGDPLWMAEPVLREGGNDHARLRKKSEKNHKRKAKAQ